MPKLPLERIKSLEKVTRGADKIHLKLHDDYSLSIAKDDLYLEFHPSKTGVLFQKDENEAELILGPIGSGKTTECLMKIVRRAALMPKMPSGVRKSRWAIIRNTRGQLETTTLNSWLNWFGEFGTYHVSKDPVLRYSYQFNDKDGRIEMEVIFLAMDHEKDVGKIKSLELTGAYINELSEMRETAYNHIRGRCGREPDKDLVGHYWAGVIADTNPPDTEHWIYKRFEVDKPANHILFKQPPGLIKANNRFITNPEADNISHLRDKYYENLAQGSSEEFIKVFCLGEYGIVARGKPVYREYNDDLHAKEGLTFNKDYPIGIGMDFGLTPAAVITQLINGTLYVLGEVTAEDMGVREFCDARLMPYLSHYFPGADIEYFDGDPSGVAKSETDHMSCFDILRQCGFLIATPALSNKPEMRLDAVRYFMTRLSNGQGCFQIDKFKVPTIRKGCIGEYQYRLIYSLTNQRYEEKPFKNAYSHSQDALQYIAMRYLQPIVNKTTDDSRALFNPVANL